MIKILMNSQKRIITQSVIGIAFIIIGVIFPDFVENIRYLFLGFVILVVGMPHGAIDHIIDGNIENWNPYSFNLTFYTWYLLAILIYSILWVYFPFYSFIFFLLITWYHFGQADTERLNLSGIGKPVIHFTRGFTVIGLIIYSDLSYASDIIAAVSGINIESTLNKIVPYETARYLIALCYPLTFVILSLVRIIGYSNFFAYFFDAIITSALFLFTDPVWAFAVYFGLWHSFNHIRIMLGYLRLKGEEVSFKWFYFQSFPFSLLSYLGLLFVYNLLNAFGNEELMVSLLLVVISVLTLPHMMVVEKLYRRFSP